MLGINGAYYIIIRYYNVLLLLYVHIRYTLFDDCGSTMLGTSN